jgi:hypothetical protein
MNVDQPGLWAGVLLGGAAVGAIAGLLPLFLGVSKNKTWLAVAGFLASVAGGLAGGIVGAAPLAGIFSVLIRPWDQTPKDTAPAPLGGSNGRSALGWYLVIMLFVQTIFLAVFWSFFMSFWMRKSFISMLLPAGAGFGLTMGIFMTALMAVVFRAGSVRVPILNSTDFLARLDRAAARLRLRQVEKDDGSVVYEPKAVLRTAATRIIVAVTPDEAVLTGPLSTLKGLKKEIEKP